MTRGIQHFGLMAVIFCLSAVASFAQTPVFTNAAIVDGNFQVQVLIASNTDYTIETSTNLVDWSPVGSDTAMTNVVTLVDPRGITGFDRLFYRIHTGLTASFEFHFLEFVNAGNFGGNTTPNVIFPVTLNSYSASMDVEGGSDFAAVTNVFFTGPSGFGLTNSAAAPNNSSINGNHAFYQSLNITNPPAAPGGTWTVDYNGTNHVFEVADPQAASHVVVPHPTVTVVSGILQSVSWVYRDATTGTTLGAPPAYMSSIQLQVHGSSELYDSPDLTPETTNHVLTSSVSWSQVSGISLSYQDTLGNNYVISFGGYGGGL